MCVLQLNTFLAVLKAHAVDPELIKQVFRQLFYWICAHSLNTLLLRKELCHWSKGMQIRSVPLVEGHADQVSATGRRACR